MTPQQLRERWNSHQGKQILDAHLESMREERRSASGTSPAVVRALARLDESLRGFSEADGVPPRADLRGVNLSGMDLDRLVFAGCYLDHAILDRASCQHTWFSSCSLVGASLRFIRAPEAMFTAAAGHEAAFDGATLIRCDFSSARIERSSFRRADLTFSWFSWAFFAGSDFSDANMTGVDRYQAIGLP